MIRAARVSALLALAAGCSFGSFPELPARKMGTIDLGAVARVMDTHRAEFTLCYQKQANRSAGTVLADFELGPDGVPDAVTIKSSSLKLPEVERCILGVIKGIQFPAPTGGLVSLSYPFTFHSPAPAGAPKKP